MEYETGIIGGEEERITITILRTKKDKKYSKFSLFEGSNKVGHAWLSNEAFEVFHFALRAGWHKTHPGKFDYAYKEVSQE